MIDFVSQEFFAFVLFFLLAIFLLAGYPVALTLAGTAIFVGTLGYLLDISRVLLQFWLFQRFWVIFAAHADQN